MKSFAVAALAIVVLGSILAVPRAGAAPPQPYNLYGIARDASAAALPQNTAIRGFIDGVDYSNGTVVYDGLGHYDMDTYGNWMTGTTSDTPEVKEGGNLGDPIMITSGDMTTAGSVFTVSKLWTPGDVITQNLGLAAAASQPALLKIESITTQPADGLTKYVYLCNPTANPVDATAYYLERDAVGSFTGPTHAIPGPATIPSGLTLYVNLTTWIGSDLTNTGDVLKLVWSNGPGSAFSGQPVVVDRVEYNATGGSGTLFWEPGNTLMSDALAPGVGQEIRRDVGCGDTNNNSVDFTLGFERGRPVTGNLPPTVTVVAPNGGEDWTGNTNHVIQWTQSDDRDSSLTDTLYYSTTGPAGPWTIITSGSFANSPNPFFTWTVPCVDSSNAYVRVFALDANSGAGQDLSDAAFTIDCTRPSLTATVPPNGQNNVGVNTNIVLTFSEAMSTAATAGAVNVGPAIGGRVDSWNGPTNTILTITHAAFSGATMYTVTVSCAALDVSNPGNQLAGCTRTFTFNTTNANAAPSVALASPAGGEDWSGGSSHTVTYTLTDPDSNPLTVDIEWSSNGGGSWNAVQMGLSQAPSATPYNYAWTVPSVDTVQAQVRVCANDGVNPRVCAPSPNFRIDATRPTVLARDPLNNAVDVSLGRLVILTFSETMARVPTEGAITFLPLVSGIVFTWSTTTVTDDTVTISHNNLAQCTTYTVTVGTGATDVSAPGNGLASANAGTFSTACAPAITITTPSGSEVWSGGSTHNVVVAMTDTDANLFVWVNVSTDGGTIFAPASGFTPGIRATTTTNLAITVPSTNAACAKVRVTAQDSTHLNGIQTSACFVIDATPPTATSVPADGATGVSLTADLTITFSEAMRASTTEPAISLSPAPPTGTLTFTWTGNAVAVHHTKLKTNTQYTLSVGIAATDISDPGNALTAYQAIFHTTSNSGLVATITGPATGNAGDVQTYDGSTSTPSGEITLYHWVFKDSAGAIQGTHDGTSASFTFGTAGAWVVNLTVSDGAGNSASTEKTVTIAAKQSGDFLSNYWWVLLLLLVAIIGAILFLVMGRRRKKEPEEEEGASAPSKSASPPRSPPKSSAPPRAAPAAAAAPASAGGKPATISCPSCGTIVDVTDTECFMCGTKL